MNLVASSRTLLQAWVLIVVLTGVVVATSIDLTGATVDDTTVVVRVQGEDGRPVSGAELVLAGVRHGGVDGSIEVAVDQPVFGFVLADGFIPEPVVVAPSAPRLVVPLVAGTGPGGPRRVLHFGGDTMLGRRYVTAGAAGGVDDAAAARSVVSDVADLFAAADLSTLNLESVVGDLDPSAAYPGKRFLLATPTYAVAALEALGADVATLGNNHAYDWQEAGIVSTQEALAAIGVAATGAGPDPDSARAPAVVDVEGLRVATLSYTTVTGDVVNDALPTADSAVPADLADGDRWQYEERSVGIEVDGDELWAPVPMRPGEAWRRFETLERELAPPAVARVWTALTAEGAFPELQDWVARRGHGGAAKYSADIVAHDVAAARDGGADLVVVQIHGGLQYAPVVSEFFAGAAREAAAAGADLVIGHHPHVLQGFDWAGDVPIAHSLGNLVFDQDFGATVRSVVLRVVVDDNGVVDVRAYPIELRGHRPVPVAGSARTGVGGQLSARSVAGVSSVRSAEGSPELVASTRWEGATISDAGWGFRVSRPDEAEITPTGGCQLLLNPSFEDDAADGHISGGGHWRFGRGASTARSTSAVTGDRVLVVEGVSDTFVRPLHRVSIGDRRNGASTFEVTAWVRGRGTLGLRLDGYRFVDTDPTRDPVSEQLGSWDADWTVASNEWSEVRFELPAEAAASGVNAVLPYVSFQPALGESLEVDDVMFIEQAPGPFGCRS